MFGNAIDVASRLNSMGKPSKIHISVDTKLLLDSIGGFRTDYRGLFEIQVTWKKLICSKKTSGADKLMIINLNKWLI